MLFLCFFYFTTAFLLLSFAFFREETVCWRSFLCLGRGRRLVGRRFSTDTLAEHADLVINANLSGRLLSLITLSSVCCLIRLDALRCNRLSRVYRWDCSKVGRSCTSPWVVLDHDRVLRCCLVSCGNCTRKNALLLLETCCCSSFRGLNLCRLSSFSLLRSGWSWSWATLEHVQERICTVCDIIRWLFGWLRCKLELRDIGV